MKPKLPKELSLVEMKKSDMEMWVSVATTLEKLPPEDRKRFACELWKTLKTTSDSNLTVILDYAFKHGLINECEFERAMKDRFICKRTGYDSLPDILLSYINLKLNNENLIFVTTNETVLKKSNIRYIKKRFGLKVIDPAEAVKLLGGADQLEKSDLDKLLENKINLDKGFGG